MADGIMTIGLHARRYVIVRHVLNDDKPMEIRPYLSE